MIRDDAKIIVTPTGVSLKEALTKEVVEALNKEASIYMNYEIPEVKLGGNPPSGKESRRTRRMLELRKRKGIMSSGCLHGVLTMRERHVGMLFLLTTASPRR